MTILLHFLLNLMQLICITLCNY